MDWESWEDWEAWEEGGGSGPAPTYTISGTISGDEVSGVTVALTGDATDSVVTAGDGTFSFTGLSNGSYTVTPTLANYNFTPASTNVTVADGDQAGKDFVSAENTYTLSGTVSGDVVEGVTITLTGDASDSTVTAGGGAYSFDLPNGDYNVEPSLYGYTFSPTDTDATISGADAAGKDFASTQVNPVLPLDLNWNDGSDLDANWIDSSKGTGTTVVNQDTPGWDSFDPVYPKCLEVRNSTYGASEYFAQYYNYLRGNGLVFDKSKGLRIQYQASGDYPISSTRMVIILYSADDNVQIQSVFNNANNPDGITARERITSPSYDQQVDENAGDTANNEVRWTTLRLEVQAGFSGNIVASSAISGSTSFSTATKSIVTDFSSVNFDYLRFMVYRTNTGYGYWNRIWIGTGDDDWPDQ